MKYLACLAAGIVAALLVAGGALAGTRHHAVHRHHRSHHALRHRATRSHAAKKRTAKAHAAKAHASAAPARTLLPPLVPRPETWVELLRDFPSNPKPLHPHTQRHKHTHPAEPRTTTLSMYEQTVKPWVLAQQGCQAARRHESGVVVLDFGKPAHEHHHYGTILFSDRFASNRRITVAMLGYARGYSSCLPAGSTAHVTLARGTSNYHPAVPSTYTAGIRWALETRRLGHMLHRHGLSDHVASAAADDAEPAWDPGFRGTRNFIHGFRMAARGHFLYDYGSLDGGVGAIWGPKQAFFVAGGIGHTKALPEIYNTAMAQEWAELARIARSRYHRNVEFAGVMTQGSASCGCGLRPHQAHRALASALHSQGVQQVPLPGGGTNIVG